MYAQHQVKPLIDQVGALFKKAMDSAATGDSVTVPFADLQIINAHAQALAVLEQRLVVACHQHRFGSTDYVFLAPTCTTFTDDDFKAFLGDVFEEGRADESVSVTHVDALETFDEIQSKTRLMELTSALQQLGYALLPAGDDGKLWQWTAPSDASTQTFATPLEAAEDAWADAVQQTRAIESITDGDWAGMTFDQQTERVLAALTDD